MELVGIGISLKFHIGDLPGHVVVVITITDVVVLGTGTVTGGGCVGFLIMVVEYVIRLVRVTGIVTGVELIVVVVYVTDKMLSTFNPLALKLYKPGHVVVVTTIIEVVYGTVTEIVVGGGVGCVLTISLVVVYTVVCVKVTGTVITLDLVVIVVYVTEFLVNQRLRELDRITNLDMSSL